MNENPQDPHEHEHPEYVGPIQFPRGVEFIPVGKPEQPPAPPEWYLEAVTKASLLMLDASPAHITPAVEAWQLMLTTLARCVSNVLETIASRDLEQNRIWLGHANAAKDAADAIEAWVDDATKARASLGSGPQ